MASEAIKSFMEREPIDLKANIYASDKITQYGVGDMYGGGV